MMSVLGTTKIPRAIVLTLGNKFILYCIALCFTETTAKYAVSAM